MVLSASAPSALNYEGDSYHYFNNQAKNALFGIIGMFIFSMIDYRIYKGKLADIGMALALILLIIVLIPGVGITINDATRWLKIGVQFQPSEIMKIALIIFLSAKISKNPDRIKSFVKGLLPCLLLLGIICALLLKEPHMSASIIMLVIGAAIMFTAGARWLHILPMGALAGVACFILAKTSEYRWKRVIIFLDPWQDKLRRWLANNTIIICNWFRRSFWGWTWKKYTKIYVHTRTT